MNWYLSKLVFRIHNESVNIPAQFDEQWRLLEAENDEAAIDKAMDLGKKENETFINRKGDRIHWEFLYVTDLVPFGKPIDGAELFSRIEQPDNERLYLQSLESKARDLNRMVEA